MSGRSPAAGLRAGAFAVLIAGAASIAPAASGETLFDAIATAYQTNPALLAARADQRAQDERYIQAHEALGPNASITEQHGIEAANVKQASLFGPPATTYNRGTTDTAQLTISQPIYTGGALSSAISEARAEVLAGRQVLRQQETVVLSQVITAYADVLLARQMMAIAGQNVEILRRQMEEVEAKVAVKEVTLTDRAQTSARLIGAQLQLTQARAQLEDARSKYQAVVGVPAGDLQPVPDLPGLPPNLETALEAADRENPQVLTSSFTELSSREQIAEAKAADGFQVGLSASASTQPIAPYLEHQNVNGVLGAVVITKTLFNAGAHGSRVREAIEVNARDQMRLADDRRQAISIVIQAWTDLSAQRQILVELNDELTQEKSAFEGSRIEARIGLRTTIDVLNAEQELQTTKVSLTQEYHDEYLARVRLLAEIGVLSAELIDPEIEPYRPEKSLAARDYLWRALPWEALIEKIDAVGTPKLSSDQRRLGSIEADTPLPSGGALPPAPHWADLDSQLSAQPSKD